MTAENRDVVIVLDAKLLRALARLEKAGRFPKRIALPDGRTTWRLSDIEKLLKVRPRRTP